MKAWEVKIVFVVHGENEEEAGDAAAEYLTSRHIYEAMELTVIEESID